MSSILFAILEPNRTINAHEATLSSKASAPEKDERSLTLIIIFRYDPLSVPTFARLVLDVCRFGSVAAICGVVAFYLATQLTRDLLKESVARERMPAHEYTAHSPENEESNV